MDKKDCGTCKFHTLERCAFNGANKYDHIEGICQKRNIDQNIWTNSCEWCTKWEGREE